jgi:hypothetical protein
MLEGNTTVLSIKLWNGNLITFVWGWLLLFFWLSIWRAEIKSLLYSIHQVDVKLSNVLLLPKLHTLPSIVNQRVQKSAWIDKSPIRPHHQCEKAL